MGAMEDNRVGEEFLVARDHQGSKEIYGGI